MYPGREYISTMRTTLSEFHSAVGRFLSDHGGQPFPNSIAMAERNAFPNPNNVASCWALGTLLMEFGADHLSAFVKLTTEPAEVMAC